MGNRPAQRNPRCLQQRVPSQVRAAGPLPCWSPRTHEHIIKHFFFFLVAPSFPFWFSHFCALLGVSPETSDGGAGGWLARSREWRARMDRLLWATLGISAALPAPGWGIREGFRHRRGGTREPHVSRRASEGSRLGGDGALGWVAGERPYIIAFLPPPPPLFGLLSFSFLALISFCLSSSPAPFSFPSSPFPLPSFPCFRSPLKRKGNL